MAEVVILLSTERRILQLHVHLQRVLQGMHVRGGRQIVVEDLPKRMISSDKQGRTIQIYISS